MQPRGDGARWLGACVGLLIPLVTPLPLLAAGRLGQNGDAIGTSSYSIDLYQGTVLAGNRVTGLSGAYVALAEDVDGNLQNPAAPAMRPFFSVDYFDYWLGLGLTFPGRLASIDFFNSGSPTEFRGAAEEPVFFTPALNLQWGSFGVGLTLELQNYSVGSSGVPGATNAEGTATLDVVLTTLHLQAAKSFFDGQLVLGAGLRDLTLDLAATAPDDRTNTLFDTSGAGLELGAVWRPNLRPFRLGVSFRSAIDTQPSFSQSLLPSPEGDIVLSGDNGALFLPERVSLPWDVNLGAAFQIGQRPLNPFSRTIDSVAERARLTFRLRQLEREDERERRLALAQTPSEREAVERELDTQDTEDSARLRRALDEARRALAESSAQVDRFYVLLSTSLVISGSVRDGVGVESFLDQRVNRSGGQVVYSPRIGAESEVWEDRLKLRAGSYLEPSRFATSHARLHGTVGADVRLFGWNVFGLWPDDFMWQLGGNLDIAPRYFSWGVSIAGWYPRHRRGEPL
jgi:hypothetical protein